MHYLQGTYNPYFWATNKTVAPTNQQLQYLHELIQARVNVNVPAITRANTLHNSDGLYSTTEGQRTSQVISNLNNVV